MTINITIDHVTINIAAGAKGDMPIEVSGKSDGALLERALGLVDLESEELARAASATNGRSREEDPDPVFEVEIRDGDGIYLHGTGPELPRLLGAALSKLVEDDAMTLPNIRRVLSAAVNEIRALGFIGARVVKTKDGLQRPLGTWGVVGSTEGPKG